MYGKDLLHLFRENVVGDAGFFHDFFVGDPVLVQTSVAAFFPGLLTFALAAFIFFPFRATDRPDLPRFMDTTDFLFAFLDILMARSVALVL